MLGVVKLNVETAVVESPIDSRQHERLNDVVKMVNDLIRQTREMTFDLHPPMLEDLLDWSPTLKGSPMNTPAAARRRRVIKSPKPAIASNFARRGTSQLSLPRDQGTGQQIPIKHGNAKEILITVHWTEFGLRVVVDDDGNGFDTTAAPPKNPPRIGSTRHH